MEPELQLQQLTVHFPKDGLCFDKLNEPAHFELRKGTADVIAFKVLSRSKAYRVHPNAGVIEGPVGRTKTISVSLSIDEQITKEQIHELSKDILLIDFVRVCDISPPAPPVAKKANRTGHSLFNWSLVEDKSVVSTLRLHSKLHPSLKLKLAEAAHAASQQERGSPKAVSTSASQEEGDGKRRHADDAAKMECDNGNSVLDVPKMTTHCEPETAGVENQESVAEWTLISEPEKDRLPQFDFAPDIALLSETMRNFDDRAAIANRVIRLLRTNSSDQRLPPLLGIARKISTAANFRKYLRDEPTASLVE